jgi:hydrogenase maturation factor
MQILDKKVKKNPKYDGVKSVISTGKTMKDVEIMSKCATHNDALISLSIRSILFINHDIFR